VWAEARPRRIFAYTEPTDMRNYAESSIMPSLSWLKPMVELFDGGIAAWLHSERDSGSA